jgi:predicted ribosomally synthesized peptide with nif11-like leader
MSLEHVTAFFTKLSTDEDFRSQIQNVKSKEECSQIVKGAGYDFTEQEFNSYKKQLLESVATEGDIEEIDEQELAVVFGGVRYQLMYGVISPRDNYILPSPDPVPPPRWFRFPWSQYIR